MRRRQTISPEQIEKNIPIRINIRKKTKSFVIVMGGMEKAGGRQDVSEGTARLKSETEARRTREELHLQVQRHWGRDSFREVQGKENMYVAGVG